MNGRVVARRLADGRTEFGFQPDGAKRILPRSRYFPAKARVDCWLQSSLVTVDGQEIGRINDRLLAVGNDNSIWERQANWCVGRRCKSSAAKEQVTPR